MYIQIPFMIPSLQNTSVDWGYYIEKSNKIGKSLAHNISWPSGKFIGGSSGMNLMFYLRGNPRDFDEWEIAGNPTWNWQTVEQYFKKAENYQTSLNDGVAVSEGTNDTVSVDEFHDNTGPMLVGQLLNEQPLKQTLFDAALELGYKQINDLNGNEYIGIGSAPASIDSNGKPFNSAKAYLAPAKNRSNLHVIKYAHVTKVNVDNTTGQVTGVQFQINKTHELNVNAIKETILSAGTVGTPHILQLSGIGPEKYLRRLNISTVRNLHSGFSLQNHITVPLFIQFNVTAVQASEANISSPAIEENIDSTDALYDYIKQRTDISSIQNIFDVFSFFNVNGTDAYPNVGNHYAVFKKGDNILIGEYLKHLDLNETVAQPIIDANQNADIAVIFVTILKPLALGKIRLRSTDPYDLPLIQSNFLDRREDIATLVQGIQLARSFLQTNAFQQIGASEIVLPMPECETLPPAKPKKVKQPKPEKNKSKKKDKKNKIDQTTTTTEAPLPVAEPIPYGSDQYFECYVKQISTTLYHQIGTAKMGPITDRFAVVDSRLNVHGLQGLRIIDASVMPKIPSVPINAATIMVAERGSDFIKEDWAAVEAQIEPQTEPQTIAEEEVNAANQAEEVKRDEL